MRSSGWPASATVSWPRSWRGCSARHAPAHRWSRPWRGWARGPGLPSLARFVDGVAVAIERGTPLGDVLRAQAQDVREATRRQLIESGGKREIAMMIPVVFLVLPVTVLFIVYPGLAVLDLAP